MSKGYFSFSSLPAPATSSAAVSTPAAASPPEKSAAAVDKQQDVACRRAMAKATALEELAVVSASTVPTPLSSTSKRALGRRTASMNMKSGTGERLFSEDGFGNIYRAPRNVDNKVYRIVRDFTTATWFQTSTTIEVDQAQGFSMTNVPDVSNFSSLFDQYRIALIEAWILPWDSNTAAVGEIPGLLASVVDYDDATSTSYAQLMEYQNVLIGHTTQAHYRKFVPHVAVAAYGSGVFTSFANEVAPWIDMASTGVTHYGLKVACNVGTGTQRSFDLVCRFTIDLRNVR
jgi:hypothetical protein